MTNALEQKATDKESLLVGGVVEAIKDWSHYEAEDDIYVIRGDRGVKQIAQSLVTAMDRKYAPLVEALEGALPHLEYIDQCCKHVLPEFNHAKQALETFKQQRGE